MSLWFSLYPTVETLIGQALAVILVLGSYVLAQRPAAATGKTNRGAS
jgi:hypothetical protein